MIKHLVFWKIKDTYSPQEKEVIKQNLKTNLEALIHKIPCASKLELIVNPLPSSNMDMCLNSEFETVELLQSYSNHPLHQDVVKTYILPYVESRSCIDYEM
ncbi:Dabb family protein [Anaerorhabdus sp.]|jgi:hypothetical protein|uniref:Dabb family protein n=1 Tax=Anaerorhabdus sp. TaxID=1872524 RepID=UPI002FC6B21C